MNLTAIVASILTIVASSCMKDVEKVYAPVVNKRITGTFPATELRDVLDMISQTCGVRLSD